ncbi:MAG: hypothetical protein ABSF46_10570 [Terriglobia bacterium]
MTETCVGRADCESVPLRFCANAVLFTALLPCVSPIVLPDTDVQLTALGTSILVLMGLFFLRPRLLSIRRIDLVVLGIGLLSFIYVRPSVAFADPTATLRACGQIVLAFPVYYAVRVLYRYMSPWVFLGVVVLYLLALALQMWWPDAYASTFAHVLSDTRWDAEGGRGPNGLCTEPSVMGNVCILFIASLYFFHLEYWKSHRNARRFVVAASCIMLVITQSGTGLVLGMFAALAALLGSKLSRRAKLAILTGFLLAIVLLGRTLSVSGSRGASIVSGVADNPLWIVAEPNFAIRVLDLYVGFHQIPSQPFGSFDVRADPDATDSALDGDAAVHIWPEPSLRTLLSNLRWSRDDTHGAGAVLERMGILGALIIVALMFWPLGFHGEWVVRTFIAGILFNASLFTPTLWFVIGCCAALRSTRKNASHRFALAPRKGATSRVCTETGAAS